MQMIQGAQVTGIEQAGVLLDAVADAVADAVGAGRRGTRTMPDALVALGLLKLDDDADLRRSRSALLSSRPQLPRRHNRARVVL